MTRRNRRSSTDDPVVHVGEHLGDAGHVGLGQHRVVVAVRVAGAAAGGPRAPAGPS